MVTLSLCIYASGLLKSTFWELLESAENIAVQGLSLVSSSEAGSLQMFDMAIPLAVGPLSLSFPYPFVIIQSSFTSMTILSIESPLSVCPIHFRCISFIVHIRALSSPIHPITSSLVYGTVYGMVIVRANFI